MADQKHPISPSKKYWDYLEDNRHRRSMADLDRRFMADFINRHPNLIDINVFSEILVDELSKLRNPKNIAKVCVTNFFVKEIFLNHVKHSEFLTEKNAIYLHKELPTDNKYDLIFSSFPWGLRVRPSDDPDGRYKSYSFKDKRKPANVSYEIIRSLDSMKMLSQQGIGICFLTSYFATFERHNFRDILEDNKLYIQAIIRTPADILKPLAAIHPIFVIVSRIKNDKEFIVDLESVDSLKNAINSFHNKTSSDNIRTGIWMNKEDFKGFTNWHHERDLKKIAGDFATYSKYKIEDICSINAARGGKKPKTFKDFPNSVFLPTIGNKNAVTKKDELQLKEQNYLQLVLDESIALPEYLAAFFNSKLGKKYIESNKTGATIKKLNISIVQKMEIGVPSIDQQREIIRNIAKANYLKEKIEDFANGLSINPISDTNAIKKVDRMIEIVSELSDSDRIRSIIRRGEDIRTEFKQTLSLDVAKKTREKYITESALKTIAAFFNTKGGDLVIGVDDKMNITGIEHELEKFHKGDTDKFLNTFKDLFKTHIGAEFYPFMDQKVVEVNNKKVFLVTCKPTNKEVFMYNTDFYVRTNPATDKLVGPSQIDYIRQRFYEK